MHYVKNILMCPPTYYTVRYEINPWMNVDVKPNKEKTSNQWKELYKVLKGLNINIYLIKPNPHLPDMVFTANGGLAYGNKFIVSNFRYPQRQKEAEIFSSWFKRKGFEIYSLPKDYYFEGEGDAFIIGDNIIAGFRFRSDIHSHNLIAEIIGKRVISLELINPNFYHLDTCFCPLDNETAIYFPGAFDNYGIKAITSLMPNTIKVGKRDAMNFCCNAVVYKKDIIMNRPSNKLKLQLEDMGFKVYYLDFSEFIKAGGSSKCLVLYI